MPPITQFVPPPKSKPAPRPAPPVAKGVLQGVAQAVAPPVSQPAAVAAVSHAAGAGLSHVAKTAGSAQRSTARAVARTARSPTAQGAYARAVIDTFNAQSDPGQTAIMRGVLANRNAFESKIIIGYLRSQAHGRPLNLKAGTGPDLGGGETIAQSLEGLYGSLKGPETSAQQLEASSGLPTTVEGGLTAGGHALSGLIGKIPHNGSSGEQIAAAQGIPTSGQIGVNAGKDLANLPAESLTSIGLPIGQLLAGHPGQALDTAFVNPGRAILSDPGGMLVKHPLDTALAVAGVAHPISRVLDAGYRRVAGKVLDLKHPSVHLTANLTQEQPNLSPYPAIRGAQRERIALRYRKTNPATDATTIDNPPDALVPRTEAARGRGIRKGVSNIVGIRERIRRANVAAQIQAHAKNVLPSIGRRFVHGVKTALKDDPKAALIPGADVLGLIADHTLRRPETAIADLTKHRDKVASTRNELRGQPNAIAEHERYIASLNAALKNTDWRRAFAAADTHAPDYRLLEDAALKTDHFGSMNRNGLDRRSLQPVVTSHMANARLDPALGMVVDEPHPAYLSALDAVAHAQDNVRHAERATASRSAMSDEDVTAAKGQITKLQALLKRIKALADRPGTEGEGLAALARATVVKKKLDALEAKVRDHAPRGTGGVEAARRHLDAMRARLARTPATRPRKLSTAEMRAFDQQMTGGRPAPSYTSHQAPKGDSAFYVNGQKYPRKEIKTNTLYAYRHGLTDPSHEALLSARVHLQGVNDAHRTMDHLLHTLTVGHPSGGSWETFDRAQQDAPPGYSPINVGRMPRTSDALTPNDNIHPATLDEEAAKHGLSINERMQRSDATGTWNLIHNLAKKQLNQHADAISPNELQRTARWATGQFRNVALATSIRHIPGILQEGLIRSIASGVFIQHWIAERNVYDEAHKINPTLADERRIGLGGGTVAGSTRALQTRQVAAHFAGTRLEPIVREWQKFMRKPGARQLGTAWHAWTHFMLDNVEKTLETHQQRAAVGKQLLNEFGGLVRLQGDAAHFAAQHGYLPEVAARRLRAGTERVYGKWTDLTPNAQMALMASPFGMWWVNSVKWLVRLPVDHPLGTAALASTTIGTEKQRIALGLDMFAPGHLPLYEQGGIPSALGLVGSNYYSPAGVANDPLSTAFDMILPQVKPLFDAAAGNDWLGHALTSPDDPSGFNGTTPGQRGLVILNSVLGMFVPMYAKLQTIAEGGGSALGTSTLWAPQTKGPNPGPLSGVAKALNPLRLYHPGSAASGAPSLTQSLGGGGADLSQSLGGGGASLSQSLSSG